MARIRAAPSLCTHSRSTPSDGAARAGVPRDEAQEGVSRLVNGAPNEDGVSSRDAPTVPPLEDGGREAGEDV